MITIGADPELFLKDKLGKMISAVNLIGGTKEEPLPLDVPGCAIQEDNVAAEFNIPPANNFEDFKRSIKYVVDHIESKVSQYGLQLARHVASHSFDSDQLMTWQAQVFGCEPDLNAWTKRENPRPVTDDVNLRSAGGHIHVGTKLNPIEVVRSMDAHLGIPSLLLDTDVKRRNLYGNAGACRIKPYGPEYRTLSNFWIWDDKLIEWVWVGTNKAVEFVDKGKTIPDDIGLHIQNAINNGDKDSLKICLEYLNV